MSDTLDSFSAMLREALGSRLDPTATSFVDMFAEDGIMQFPFAPAEMRSHVEGRAALVDHLTELGHLIAFDRISAATVHAMADPQSVVLEFTGSGRGIVTGEPYEQRYISVIRTAGGRIVHYIDYWNPLALLRATRGSQDVTALTGGEARRG